jgi:hypothetical protein
MIVAASMLDIASTSTSHDDALQSTMSYVGTKRKRKPKEARAMNGCAVKNRKPVTSETCRREMRKYE